MFGVGENKAAKDFSRDEINGQGHPFKNKYWRRMKIWRLQGYLMNHGFTLEAANGKIQDVYGTEKITPLIVVITRHQKNPNYPFIGQQRFHPRLVINPH